MHSSAMLPAPKREQAFVNPFNGKPSKTEHRKYLKRKQRASVKREMRELTEKAYFAPEGGIRRPQPEFRNLNHRIFVKYADDAQDHRKPRSSTEHSANTNRHKSEASDGPHEEHELYWETLGEFLREQGEEDMNPFSASQGAGPSNKNRATWRATKKKSRGRERDRRSRERYQAWFDVYDEQFIEEEFFRSRLGLGDEEFMFRNDRPSEHAIPRSHVEHYTILGLPHCRLATEEEVKSAFRRLALECHPDKLASASSSETSMGNSNRKAAEEKFKRIITAYKTLVTSN